MMHKEGDEIHLDEDEARSGSTPHIVRYILAISLLLAIVALSAIWMTGAIMQGNAEEETRMSGIERSTEAEGNEATRTVPNPATE